MDSSEREVEMGGSGDGCKPAMRAHKIRASRTLSWLGRTSDGPSETWMVPGEHVCSCRQAGIESAQLGRYLCNGTHQFTRARFFRSNTQRSTTGAATHGWTTSLCGENLDRPVALRQVAERSCSVRWWRRRYASDARARESC